MCFCLARETNNTYSVKINKLGVVVDTFIPSTPEAEAADVCEFEAWSTHRENSRPARATQ